MSANPAQVIGNEILANTSGAQANGLLSHRRSWFAATLGKQNWILNPKQDALFIIAAPLLVLAFALVIFNVMTPADSTALIILVHIVLTVAHHMPTFIRIYGDVDLVRRFKWSFVLAPVVPIVFSAGVLGYINYHRYPVEYFLYLYIMLALWDPWHFLRQHYGFMRIYDRHNAAPSWLTSRMDWWLCVIWFVYIMLASGDWLPSVLQDLYISARLPLVLAIPQGAVAVISTLMRDVAIVATLVYAAYLLWCRRQGYFISVAKLALLSITFGVMYLTYTPNQWILNLAPGWTFKIGFATLGIVHMTQYLAIVWRYNRSIAVKKERSRAGLFSRLHTRGGWLVGSGYVLFCVLYGELITTSHDNRWLMSMLLMVGFTSTLMHYYFDGFIWKVRHQQNIDALVTHSTAVDKENFYAADHALRKISWWSSASQASAPVILLRQIIYFGIPMTVLTIGAFAVWQSPATNYVQHMYRAQAYNDQGRGDAAEQEASIAFTAMKNQLPLARKMVDLQPTAAREAELAFLIYNYSLYKNVVRPALAGQKPTNDRLMEHRDNIKEAITLMATAIEEGGDLAHAGRNKISRDEVIRVLASWRQQVGND